MQSVDHPVIGYRSWYTDDRPDQPFLKSIVQNNHWEKQNEARCMRPAHWHRGPAPGDGCECGLYAFHGLEQAFGYSGKKGVTGIVRGWGLTRIHRDGWRAQYAEVLAIIEPKPPEPTAPGWVHAQGDWVTRHRDLARQAAEYYQVPLIPYQAAEVMASEFGKFVPEEIRPDSSIYSGSRGLSWKENVVAMLTVMTPLLIAIMACSVTEMIWRRHKRRRSR